MRAFSAAKWIRRLLTGRATPPLPRPGTTPPSAAAVPQPPDERTTAGRHRVEP